MSTRWLPLGAIGVSVLLWSSAYALSAIALETSSAAVLSVGRFAIALLILVPLAALRPGFLRALRTPRTILLGLTGVTLYYSLANIGLLFTTPGTAALTAALLPALTAVLAVVMLRERLSRRTIVGLVLATIGVGLVAASGFRIDLGVLLNVVALASYALYTVLLRRDAERSDAPDALVLATATGVWGTAIMLPWLGWEMATGTAQLPSGLDGIGSILFLGLVVTAPDARAVQLRRRARSGGDLRSGDGGDPGVRLPLRSAARGVVRPDRGDRRGDRARRRVRGDARDAIGGAEPARDGDAVARRRVPRRAPHLTAAR